MKNNKTVDEIILSYSTRGMDLIQKEYPKTQFCRKAVENFLELDSGIVFLYTGFYVQGHAETDGPVGTYFLALALEKLGYKPVIVSDKYCLEYFKDITPLYMPLSGTSKKDNKKILKEYNPICHISIERLGRDSEGRYLNSKGIDISEHTAPLDELFMQAKKKAPTIAIGDGGNEIGMGNFKEFTKEALHVEPCVVESDYPIVASVSNWGAYGFIAYLQFFTRKKLLPDIEEVEEYMEHILSLGCIDGLTGKNEKSIDGKEWHTEEEILLALNRATLPK